MHIYGCHNPPSTLNPPHHRDKAKADTHSHNRDPRRGDRNEGARASLRKPRTGNAPTQQRDSAAAARGRGESPGREGEGGGGRGIVAGIHIYTHHIRYIHCVIPGSLTRAGNDHGQSVLSTSGGRLPSSPLARATSSSCTWKAWLSKTVPRACLTIRMASSSSYSA